MKFACYQNVFVDDKICRQTWNILDISRASIFIKFCWQKTLQHLLPPLSKAYNVKVWPLTKQQSHKNHFRHCINWGTGCMCSLRSKPYVGQLDWTSPKLAKHLQVYNTEYQYFHNMHVSKHERNVRPGYR